MDLSLDAGLAADYHSNSQKARVLTESWVGHELYCPHCNCTRIEHFPNNTPVADFFCTRCGSQYELKSKSGNIRDRVVDGAYDSMIQRISGNENPDFFFMGYSLREMRVLDLIMMPRFFFVPAIIERRNPLSANARRAGWVSCNIRLDQIPIQGRIPIVTDGTVMNPRVVTEKVRMSQALEMRDMSSRGWLMDVLNCVNRLPAQVFTLEQVYRFEDELSLKHPGKQAHPRQDSSATAVIARPRFHRIPGARQIQKENVNMKTYRVSIEETVAQEFDISADSPEEARSIAIAEYKRGDIVLEPGEVQYRQIAVLSPVIDEPEWEQF